MSGPLELHELFGVAAAVDAALSEGLLGSLLEREATAARHAAALGLDSRAVELMLPVLVSLGLAERAGDRFRASAAFAQPVGGSAAALGQLTAVWRGLPRFLHTGEPYVAMDGAVEERATAYQELVALLGRLFGELARALAEKLPPAREILDVGAGAGVWSLAMLAAAPEARATAVDLPSVVPAYHRAAEALGLAARVGSLAGDYHQVPLPAGRFDRIVVANVLHLEPPERAASLVTRLADALAPGGQLVVVGHFKEGLARDLYELNRAMRTVGGANHRAEVVEGWLRAAGLGPATMVDPDRPPRGLLALVASRPT